MVTFRLSLLSLSSPRSWHVIRADNVEFRLDCRLSGQGRIFWGLLPDRQSTARKRDDCRPSDAYLETLAERIGDFINSSREGIAALKSDQLNLSETQSPGYLSP